MLTMSNEGYVILDCWPAYCIRMDCHMLGGTRRFTCPNPLKRPAVAETVMRSLPVRAVTDTLPEVE